ncbi:MAG: helix-turn-helix transcriptional regulator [Chloroflexi bacterium]|nr:helix-turn-helix transcriptional regulator [Chloroflexota bacterium]
MKNSIDTNLPLSEQTYFILLSLRASPKHGYAIAKDVQTLSNGRVVLSVSTLYTTIKRLLDDKWIKLIDTTTESNRPRKIYELTKAGGNVLLVEVQRLGTLVSAARISGMEGIL